MSDVYKVIAGPGKGVREPAKEADKKAKKDK